MVAFMFGPFHRLALCFEHCQLATIPALDDKSINVPVAGTVFRTG